MTLDHPGSVMRPPKLIPPLFHSETGGDGIAKLR